MPSMAFVMRQQNCLAKSLLFLAPITSEKFTRRWIIHNVEQLASRDVNSALYIGVYVLPTAAIAGA